MLGSSRTLMPDDPRVASERIYLRVTRDEKEQFRQCAVREGVSLSELIRESLERRCTHTSEPMDLR